MRRTHKRELITQMFTAQNSSRLGPLASDGTNTFVSSWPSLAPGQNASVSATRNNKHYESIELYWLSKSIHQYWIIGNIIHNWVKWTLSPQQPQFLTTRARATAKKRHLSLAAEWIHLGLSTYLSTHPSPVVAPIWDLRALVAPCIALIREDHHAIVASIGVIGIHRAWVTRRPEKIQSALWDFITALNNQ